MTNEELQRLLDEATPGPWVRDCWDILGRATKNGGGTGHVCEISRPNETDDKYWNEGEEVANSSLISAAPDLAREVLALRSERDVAFAAGFEAAREAAARLAAPDERSSYIDQMEFAAGDRQNGWRIHNKIRTLTPPDASEALAARDRKMRAEGMRMAAAIADDVWEGYCVSTDEKFAIQECEARILAAADKEENADD